MAWSAHAAEAGKPAPDIGLSSLKGKPVSLSTLRGKVVIVDFMASWCGPCKEELPELEKLYRRYKGHGLSVVAVSVDKNAGNLRDFMKKVPVSFPVVHDAKHEVASRYEPPRMPSSYIIDRKGRIRHVHAGFEPADVAKIEQEVRALLR